jgi:hypothetical protein
MWPAEPLFIRTTKECHLVVYSACSVDIFDAYKGIWLQTIPTRNVRPLDPTASISLHTNDSESRRLCFLSSLQNQDDIQLPQQINPSSPRHGCKLKWKMLIRNKNGR